MKSCVSLVVLLTLHTCHDAAVAQRADELAESPPSKKIFLPANPRAAAYILRLQKNEDLIQLQRSEPVYIALLERAGLPQRYRLEALDELAKMHQTGPLTELLAAITRVAAADDNATEVLRDLAGILLEYAPAKLSPQRQPLTALALDAPSPLARQIAWAALITADQSVSKTWDTFRERGKSKVDLLGSIELLPVSGLRSEFYPYITAQWDATDAEVRRAAIAAAAHLSGHQTEVLAKLTDLVNRDVEVESAVRALQQIAQRNEERWMADASSSLPVAQALLSLLRRTTASERTVSPAREALLLTQDIVRSLPPDQAEIIRPSIDQLAVRQFVIVAPYEQMAYAPNVIVAKAGAPMEIVFRNDDDKPHNLLIGKPGSWEEIGLAAQAMATSPDAQAKHYIPDLDAVLQATTMVWPDQEERLALTAPAETGVYPFVCTFPGHWLKMYGVLVVVDDLDQYLAANRPLPTADELLGRKFVKEWTYADLDRPAARLHAERRDFASGKTLFAKASCVSCHKIRGEGVGNIGPELSDVAERLKKPQDVLREIVEPSRSIDEKYASVILYVNGKTVKGVVVKRTPQQVLLKENPLVNCEPTVVSADEIDEEEKSPLSPMPTGLLNALDQDQILDLLAYVYSGGDPDHALFTIDTAAQR